MSVPPLTPSQSMRLLIDNDARNIRDVMKPWGIWDSAVHASAINAHANALVNPWWKGSEP